MIQWVKVNKASDAFEISNRALQASLTELTSILISLFNSCVIHKYHSKQFKKAQTIVLCKSKKSDYIDLKMYWLIALLVIMNKTLESIMIKRLSDITETHHMLSNAQMRTRHKWFMISALNLLVDQVHAVWDCKIKYVIFLVCFRDRRSCRWPWRLNQCWEAEFWFSPVLSKAQVGSVDVKYISLRLREH